MKSRKKWCWWINFQCRNGVTDVENELGDTVGEGEGGTNWKIRIDIYILLLLLSCSICFQPSATSRTVAHQTPPSMGFSRQEYCGGLPFPSPGDLPNPGIEPESPASLALQAVSLPCINEMVSGKLLCHRELSLVLCDDIGGRMRGWGVIRREWIQSTCSWFTLL